MNKDELEEKFKKLRMQIFTKLDSIPTVLSDYPTDKTVKECAEISDRYVNSKLEELEKWVDKELSYNSTTLAIVKYRINSLKQES